MRHCYVLRVFTRGSEGGNHLGVVTDVTGLGERTMQEIAHDLGFSETAFVDWRQGGVPQVRIFTPTVEMPFAGHPLVGTAWVLGMIGPGTIDRLRCEVGEIPFRIDGTTVWVDTPLVTDVESVEAGSTLEQYGLPRARRSWVARMPLDYLVCEMRDASLVMSAAPDFAAMTDRQALYLFAREGSQVTARFFAPALGVDEDPATGSAASALAAVLAHEGESQGRVTIRQGDAIGWGSTIELEWSEAASLGGTVVRDEVRVLEA